MRLDTPDRLVFQFKTLNATDRRSRDYGSPVVWDPADLIGVNEEPEVQVVDAAAETLPLDEETIRAIFGSDEDDPE